jgi:hypothetical protein
VDLERFVSKLDAAIEDLDFYRRTPELLACLSRESQGLLVEIHGLTRLLPAARYVADRAQASA